MQRNLEAGKTIELGWDQKDSRGRQVEPGHYQIEFKHQNRTSTATFHIEGEVIPPDEETELSGQITFKTREQEYGSGQNVRFILENGTPRTLNLAGIRYVVEVRSQSGAWREFYTSPSNFLSVQSLVSGQMAFWEWNRWDNEHQVKLSRAAIRISLFMPGVRENAYLARCRIRSE
jgi:hypothetical protein